jgi:hypothetical protein
MEDHHDYMREDEGEGVGTVQDNDQVLNPPLAEPPHNNWNIVLLIVLLFSVYQYYMGNK